ncbi:riboflavin synthase [Leucobacter exalbidus]|uniref:Riboflavin synthase n=1 Tax=Leucobacter exalbidus TaxID=662960 RepID=A0A940PV38_9MICO|nr:riboflavin synthase [Leucobacter exalbidus]MBP1326780.1 riboflavin synthase [Leucobacter exalbidus]
MFTGLIEEIGEIVAVTPIDDSLRLTIAGPLVTSDADHGASICVSGVCLTVIDRSTPGQFTADVMAQTLNMSTIGGLAAGSGVNLERAVRMDTRLGGHIVQGHVDGTARLVSVTEHEAWRVLRFAVAHDIAALLVDKGSITVSGVSLTVSNVSAPEQPEHWFEVSLIPETLTATTLGRLTAGDLVNVETDILARHVARMLRMGFTPGTPSSSPLSTIPTEGPAS